MTDNSTDNGILPNPNNYLSEIPFRSVVIAIIIIYILFLGIYYVCKNK